MHVIMSVMICICNYACMRACDYCCRVVMLHIFINYDDFVVYWCKYPLILERMYIYVCYVWYIYGTCVMSWLCIVELNPSTFTFVCTLCVIGFGLACIALGSAVMSLTFPWARLPARQLLCRNLRQVSHTKSSDVYNYTVSQKKTSPLSSAEP